MTQPQPLRVVHETVYRYAPRVDIAYHLACLMPADDLD